MQIWMQSTAWWKMNCILAVKCMCKNVNKVHSWHCPFCRCKTCTALGTNIWNAGRWSIVQPVK